MPRELTLSHHGELLASYEGEGVLTLSGGHELDCRFLAGQRRDGELVLTLHVGVCLWDFDALTFEGRDSQSNFRLSADEGLVSHIGSMGFGREGAYSLPSFTPRRIFATSDSPAEPSVRRFGITNYEFRSFGRTPGGQVTLPLPVGDLGISIERVCGYDEAERRMKTLRNVEVTAEVVIPCRPGLDYEAVVSDVCQLLSIARGTRVQWIYCRTEAVDGGVLSVEHFHRFTARYTNAAIFHASPTDQVDFSRFLRTGYPRYLEMRESHGLDRGLVEGYIEAKAAGDFIERRAVKLAVAVEMFKDAFLRLPDPPVSEHIIPKKRFNKLREGLKGSVEHSLLEAGVPEADVKDICAKLPELNRTSFQSVLRAIFGRIGLVVEDAELKAFVRCRNEIVHTGKFPRLGEDERRFLFSRQGSYPSAAPLDGSDEDVAAFLFMESFVDRIFLKLLGYSGPYRDARYISPANLHHGGPAVLE